MFMPRPGRERILPLPSLTICSNAARRTIHILDTFHRQRDTDFMPLDTTSNLQTALVLLVGILRSEEGCISSLELSKEMQDVYRCIKLLQIYEKKYQTAGRILDVLNVLVTVCLPNSPYRKRARSPGDYGERRIPALHAQMVREDFNYTHDDPRSTHKPYTTSEVSTVLPEPYNGQIFIRCSFKMELGCPIPSLYKPAYPGTILDRQLPKTINSLSTVLV
ncbi:hypothetical protein E1B28_006376 [Marasmius oreades]|uniref:Uncharacterized protein n=1 Tax=Marasmius oreades TaxID=181124 RepID=A0A9P7S588_9AGAR|nr:uncharacterized protein E1B28_006376 [Marasmius oreades]KAG7095654.1 hypothetical protein E1B28_006376 [Marasmius oreades]